MKMKPMGDQVLLKKQSGQEQTKSGIILTANSKHYEYADVISTGPGLFNPMNGLIIPMTCKVGDVVLLHSRLIKGDNEVELDDEKYVLVRESEIAMVSTK